MSQLSLLIELPDRLDEQPDDDDDDDDVEEDWAWWNEHCDWLRELDLDEDSDIDWSLQVDDDDVDDEDELTSVFWDGDVGNVDVCALLATSILFSLSTKPSK